MKVHELGRQQGKTHLCLNRLKANPGDHVLFVYCERERQRLIGILRSSYLDSQQVEKTDPRYWEQRVVVFGQTRYGMPFATGKRAIIDNLEMCLENVVMMGIEEVTL